MNQADHLFNDNVREDFRNYLTHPSGIKRITSIIVTLPKNVSSGNVEILKKLKNIEIERGENYEITLIFDKELQGKEMSISSSYTLTIKY